MRKTSCKIAEFISEGELNTKKVNLGTHNKFFFHVFSRVIY